MRILVVSPFLPYVQAKSGAPRAIFDKLQLLSPRHTITLATFVAPGEASHKTALAQLNVRTYGVTRHDSATRTTGLWRKRARLAAGLLTDRRPMLVQEFGSRAMCRLLERVTRDQNFDVVMFEHILMAQYMRCIQQHTGLPTILVEHDVRAAFPSQQTLPDRRALGVTVILARVDRAKWASYASRAYRQATRVIVPTDEDAKLLERKVLGVHAQVVPFGLPTAVSPGKSREGSMQAAPNREADTLLFVGNFDHPPNRDAARWLCNEIMPPVWQKSPSVVLWLVGRNPTSDIEALGSDRVRVWGEVPSVGEYLEKCTLFVAPLRQGGGMRIKLLEALSAGAPVVTTTLGSQGLDAENGRHLLVADSAEGLAGCILQLLGDPALAERLGTEGERLVSGMARLSERAEKLERVLERVVVENEETPDSSNSGPAGVAH
jgi:glycosyltransferase involved in cell wall biosynthesis